MLLGIPGFIGAFVLALVIVVPVLIRALRGQDASLRRERAEQAATDSAQGMAAAHCPQCGSVNRVPVDAIRALCGSCHGELNRTPSAVA